jgi:hypothetical protein
LEKTEIKTLHRKSYVHLWHYHGMSGTFEMDYLLYEARIEAKETP